MKIIGWTRMAGAGLVLWAAVVMAGDTITIGKTEEKSYRRVNFRHQQHAASTFLECTACHHQGEFDVSCSASGCHTGRKGTAVLHKMCIGCHMDAMETGPIKCVECHQAEKEDDGGQS